MIIHLYKMLNRNYFSIFPLVSRSGLKGGVMAATAMLLTIISTMLSICLVPVSAQNLPGGGGGMAGGGMGGFGGPAVLGRGAANGVSGNSIENGFRFYGGLTAGYDNGLTATTLDADGNISSTGSTGIDGVLGVYGYKSFRRMSVNLNYRGGYRQYSRQDSFNGLDQTLALSVQRQLTSRTGLGFSASAGTTNRAFGLSNISGFIDPNVIAFGSPNAELFDNRIYYTNASVNYVWQRTARSSVHFSGNGFLTRRTGNVLFGVNGGSGGADYAYRMSRTQTISAGYNYFFFNYTRNFGDAHGNGVFLGYSKQIGRRYQIAFRGGATRVESLFLRSVQVDPIIAAIVGIGTTQEVFYGISYLPNGNLSFGGPVGRRGNFNVSGGVSVAPGNGVITTSRNWNGGASYSYTGLRRLGLNVASYYNKMSSIVGAGQSFTSLNTSLSATPRLRGDFFLTFSLGNRRFLEGVGNTFRRNSYSAQVGITWSPGELPVNFR